MGEILRKPLSLDKKNLEFSKKSFHFDGGNLEFPLSLEEKSWFLVKNPGV